MRKASLTGLILFFMFLPWGNAWAGPTAGELLALLPPEKSQATELTRGGFTVMLAAAAGIKGVTASGDLPVDVPRESWYTPALLALWQQGIIQGYPNGTLRPEQPITCLEAVILTARAMGLPNEISGREDNPSPGALPYGLSQYTFFRQQGLLPPGEPLAPMSPEKAARWLAEVFGSESRAENLLARCRQAMAAKTVIRIRGVISLELHNRPGLPATTELDHTVIYGDVVNEVTMAGKMHQMVTLHLEKQRDMTIEQFVSGGYLYRRMTGGRGEEGDWQRLSPAPDVTSLLRQQQNLGLPANIYPFLHYHLLGEKEIAGRHVVGVSFYTRQNNPGAPGDILPPLVFNSGPDDYFNQPGRLIRSLSYWGIIYLDPDNLLPVRSDLNLVLAFEPAPGGRTAVVAALEARFQGYSYAFDDFKIELPPAVAAPVKEN